MSATPVNHLGTWHSPQMIWQELGNSEVELESTAKMLKAHGTALSLSTGSREYTKTPKRQNAILSLFPCKAQALKQSIKSTNVLLWSRLISKSFKTSNQDKFYFPEVVQ